MAEHVQMSLIETHKLGYEKFSSKNNWILDSRTSWHMTNFLANLSHVTDMDPIPMNYLMEVIGWPPSKA